MKAKAKELRLLSVALWAIAVGAAAGSVHALTQHNGATAWDLIVVALFALAGGVVVDLARKLVTR
jgi:uncharacterized membrane-anchored protein